MDVALVMSCFQEKACLKFSRGELEIQCPRSTGAMSDWCSGSVTVGSLTLRPQAFLLSKNKPSVWTVNLASSCLSPIREFTVVDKGYELSIECGTSLARDT